MKPSFVFIQKHQSFVQYRGILHYVYYYTFTRSYFNFQLLGLITFCNLIFRIQQFSRLNSNTITIIKTYLTRWETMNSPVSLTQHRQWVKTARGFRVSNICFDSTQYLSSCLKQTTLFISCSIMTVIHLGTQRAVLCVKWVLMCYKNCKEKYYV